MLIEYKIKLQSDGLTITQRIEGGGSAAQVKPGPPVVQNSLGASIQDSQATDTLTSRGGGPFDPEDGGGPFDPEDGGGPFDPEDGGGPFDPEDGGDAANFGASPITIIGPIILACPPPPHSSTSGESGNRK